MDKEVLDKLEQIKKYTLLQAKNYLNVEDLCNYIGMSKAQVYAKMREHAFPYSKPCGKLAFFLKVILMSGWVLIESLQSMNWNHKLLVIV